MAEVASAYVSLLPSMAGFGRKLDRQITPELDAAGKKGGSRFAAGLKAAVGPALALVGTAAATSFLKDSIGEAREAQKVGALTTNVIKQTGGAANISAKQVGDLATAISLKTGMDDEAIQSGANLLLTFKNVANQAGKNNKIFDRATRAAADLSAAGFGDLAGTSKQLGKALNDPIKGMSALGRSGVTFTEAQKTQIAAMVKNGDLLGAQKVLLREVESQVGGAAAATATSGEKAAVAFGNLKESIGAALLPVVDKVATYLVSTFIPALYKIPPFFASLRQYIGPVVSFFQSFNSGASGSTSVLDQFRAYLTSAFASVRSIFQSTVSIVTSLWGAFGSTLTNYARSSISNVLTVVRGLYTVLEGIFKTIAAVLKGDWKGAWDGIKTIVRGAMTVVQGVVKQGLNVVRTLLSAAKTVITSAGKAAFEGIKSGAMAGWDKAKTYVKGLPTKIAEAIGDLGTLLRDAGVKLISGLVDGIKSKFGDVKSTLGDLTGKLTDWKGPPKKDKTLLTPAGRLIMDGLVRGFREGSGGVESYLNGLTKTIGASLELKKTRPGMSKKARRRVQDFNDDARKAIKAQKAAVDQLGKSLSALGGKIDNARSNLQGLQDARASLSSQTASSVSGELDLTETKGKKLSFATVAANVSGLASRAKAFAGKLRGLLAAGIPAGLVQEVASLGTVQGSGVADALLSGSKQQIGQLASDYQGIDTYSKQIGDIVAGSMYDAGIAAQQGILKGLLDDAAIQGAANRLASKLTKAVKKSLGIKSPSKVFQNEVGQYLPAGIVAGIDDGQRALDRRVAGMVQVAKIGKVVPGDFGSGVAASAQAPVVQKIYPQPGQSEQEIGNAAANRLMWAMAK